MSKSSKITLLFVLIFLVGVLSFVAYINHSLENATSASTKDIFEDDISFYKFPN